MFKSIAQSFKRKISVADLVIMAILVALAYILSLLDIYITPSFKLFTLEFLPNSIGAALFGPLWGGIMGIATDITAFIAKPMGGFFPGYTLSAMLGNVIYGIFLYGRPSSKINAVIRAGAAQLAVTVFITLGLNMVWLVIMYGKTAGEIYTGARLLSNIIQFPFKTALILLFTELARSAYSKVFGK